MKNLWGKFSRPATVQQNIEQTNEHKQFKVDYYNLRDIEEKLKNIDPIQVFSFQNANVQTLFQDLLSTLHGLLSIIQELKKQTDKNQAKLGEYQRLKNLVSQHSQIVCNIEEQNSKNLNRVYEQKRKQRVQFEQKLIALQLKIRVQEEEKERQKQNQEEKQGKIKSLTELIEQKQSIIKNLSEEIKFMRKRINDMQVIEDSSLKLGLGKSAISISGGCTFQNILIYSKLRTCLYTYLDVPDFVSLALTNKHINYICQKTFKKDFIRLLIMSKNMKVDELSRSLKQQDKIIDTFPPDNIKTNAIKYLFFKIKPGAYILPYFQIEESQEKIQQKSKLGAFSNFFKKKIENQTQKEKMFTFEALKNDHEFKETQKKIDTFFDKLFAIQGEFDLKNFSQIMKKQFTQLKSELKNVEKGMQILCISRYLYLQINELNNLLQVCFALLLNKHHELNEVKHKSLDLKQNDKVLRNLVENMASEREEAQKRIFFLENQQIRNRALLQNQSNQLIIIKENSQILKLENDRYSAQINQLRKKVAQLNHQREDWISKWQDICSIAKQALPDI